MTDGDVGMSKGNRLLRRSEVEARTGLGRSTIYAWMDEGKFPRPVRLGSKMVAWRESDVDAWIDALEKHRVWVEG